MARPKDSKKPAYAAVEELARRMRPHCSSDREAVRRAADVYLDMGDIIFGEGHPAGGIIPTPEQEREGKREAAADQSRQKARMAKWEKLYGKQPETDGQLQSESVKIEWAEPLPESEMPPPPPWPETMLDSRDTVIDQIARRLSREK